MPKSERQPLPHGRGSDGNAGRMAPRSDGGSGRGSDGSMPSGALTLLILRVLRSGTLHGYAIAQRIHSLSSEVLQVEEGALYPALQKILLKGWATSEWGISETNRKVRFYRLTTAGRKQLDAELSGYHRVHEAIAAVLRTA